MKNCQRTSKFVWRLLTRYKNFKCSLKDNKDVSVNYDVTK